MSLAKPPLHLYPTLPDLSYVRLLSIPTGPNLSCKLHAFPLTECPDYIALPYVWGHHEPKNLLTIEGRNLFARDKIYSALKEWKFSSHDSEYFWIDATCTDQSFVEERNT